MISGVLKNIELDRYHPVYFSPLFTTCIFMYIYRLCILVPFVSLAFYYISTISKRLFRDGRSLYKHIEISIEYISCLRIIKYETSTMCTHQEIIMNHILSLAQ